MSLIERASIPAIVEACHRAGLKEYARCSHQMWPRLHRELRFAGCNYLSIRATGSEHPTVYHVFSEIRCAAGQPWLKPGESHIARLLDVWLHLRREDEIEWQGINWNAGSC